MDKFWLYLQYKYLKNGIQSGNFQHAKKHRKRVENSEEIFPNTKTTVYPDDT